MEEKKKLTSAVIAADLRGKIKENKKTIFIFAAVFAALATVEFVRQEWIVGAVFAVLAILFLVRGFKTLSDTQTVVDSGSIRVVTATLTDVKIHSTSMSRRFHRPCSLHFDNDRYTANGDLNSVRDLYHAGEFNGDVNLARDLYHIGDTYYLVFTDAESTCAAIFYNAAFYTYGDDLQ